MLPKQNRLNLKKSFKWALSGGKRQSANFKIYYKFSDNIDPLIGVALSSKVFKKAVLRNKAKRKSLKAIEKIYPLLQTGLNLVIMPKIDVLKLDQDLLDKEIEYVKDINNSN